MSDGAQQHGAAAAAAESVVSQASGDTLASSSRGLDGRGIGSEEASDLHEDTAGGKKKRTRPRLEHAPSRALLPPTSPLTNGGKMPPPLTRKLSVVSPTSRRVEEDDDSSQSEDEEDAADYKRGGYHPVKVGDTFRGRYRVIQKLGWGHFSTVWLVRDLKAAASYAALKIVKSAPQYTDAAQDEIKLLCAVRDTSPDAAGRHRIVLLLDHFKHQGPNGTHVCMVMEVLGCPLLKLIKLYEYNGLPKVLLRRIVQQTLEGLAYLHGHCRIIHTDIKPENILVCLSKEDVQDLGQRAEAQAASSKSDKLSNAGSAAAAALSSGKKLSKTQKRNLKRRLKKSQAAAAAAASSPSAGANPSSASVPASAAHDDTEESANTSLPLDAAQGQGLGVRSQESEAAAAAVTRPVDWAARVFDPAWLSSCDIKIADLGNACWVDRHFSADIQTRQYRCLEVILGAPYGPSADIWSVACMAFELATGDYLFEPHTGDNYSRDEDHVALIIELLGTIPKHIALSGEYSREVFTRRGELRHIKGLKPWGLESVLHEKYRFNADEATSFTTFLLPMLDMNPSRRASAATALTHGWLSPDDEQLGGSLREQGAVTVEDIAADHDDVTVATSSTPSSESERASKASMPTTKTTIPTAAAAGGGGAATQHDDCNPNDHCWFTGRLGLLTRASRSVATVWVMRMVCARGWEKQRRGPACSVIGRRCRGDDGSGYRL
eukprot:m.113643 g.113643  ORF g.113643 m.113643 type:complete len:719 (-) comp16254_c5_seq1:1509-3665(-)